jgi:cell wall-associated NlpC family hydrolase
VAGLDPRVNAFRADLAAASLKGAVNAPRFADGHTARLCRGVAPLRVKPDRSAGLNTQLLFGEGFTVYDEEDGWSWGQSHLDGYVGYLQTEILSRADWEPTHRVAVLSTPLLPAPEVKRAAIDLLPMNAKVRVVRAENRFSKLEGGRFVYAAHLVPLSDRCADWVSVAEEFLGAPYLWGGKTHAGCDCSGLIQSALERGGIAAPRDTDMMGRELGSAYETSEDFAGLQRGDLVFWKGHVGVMLDSARLLHANAFHMRVAIEPLKEAVDRIANSEGSVRAVKRLS